jgi:hypothetical protein
MKIMKYLFVMLAVLTPTIFYSAQTVNANGKVTCSVVQMAGTDMSDSEWIAKNMGKTFMVTIGEEQIFLSTFSSDYGNSQDIYKIIKEDFVSFYAININSFGSNIFAISKELGEATLVVQGSMFTNIWELNCR